MSDGPGEIVDKMIRDTSCLSTQYCIRAQVFVRELYILAWQYLPGQDDTSYLLRVYVSTSVTVMGWVNRESHLSMISAHV